MSKTYFGLEIPFLDVLGVEPEFAENGHSRIRLHLRVDFLVQAVQAEQKV